MRVTNVTDAGGGKAWRAAGDGQVTGMWGVMRETCLVWKSDRHLLSAVTCDGRGIYGTLLGNEALTAAAGRPGRTNTDVLHFPLRARITGELL